MAGAAVGAGVEAAVGALVIFVAGTPATEANPISAAHGRAHNGRHEIEHRLRALHLRRPLRAPEAGWAFDGEMETPLQNAMGFYSLGF